MKLSLFLVGVAAIAFAGGYSLRPAIDNFIYTDVYFSKADKECPYGWLANNRYMEVGENFSLIENQDQSQQVAKLCIYEPVMRSLDIAKADG